VDDERLRHQRLDEPAGLKQRRAGWVPAVEDPQHDEEGRIVEDRANGADAEDEPPDLLDVPGPRAGHLLFVHSVPWDRDLREVVQEVVGQHLDRGDAN
jgi:hypothetical protein